MKTIKPSVEILTDIDDEEVLKLIEKAGRVCYKSESNIKDGSAKKFIGSLVRAGHESVIEHFNITVKFITDRGNTHQIVRHRLASYSQESTRYCNYSKDKFDNEINVIQPYNIQAGTVEYGIWHKACVQSEKAYFELIDRGVKAETARAILPTCLKTELIMTANLREWRHFFKMRTSKAAQPDVRALAIDLLKQFQGKIPVIFDDITAEE